MRWFILSFFGLLSVIAQAQPGGPIPSSEIFQKIKKLNVLGSVLYVAAHPDDENTRLIAYLSNDRLYRTAYLSMTRGDGGQNLIGNEQGVALGLIRTQELLSARKIDGGEQFFTRAFDFGYSKGPEETFRIWDKEKILSDVVWVIRKFRPDIIITRFPTTGEGGHGHHTASAFLAEEAFAAAADPNRFPEQFQYGVSVWKPKRLLWNTFNFGAMNTTARDQFNINVGGYNTLLGESYGEISALSRSQHKSQGFGVPSSRGAQYEYFKTIKGPAPVQTLMDGVDASWARIGHSEIATEIAALQDSFSFVHPEKSIPALLAIYKAIDALPSGYWKAQKLEEVKDLIRDCSGLFMEMVYNSHYVVPGDSASLVFNSDNRLGVPVIVNSVSFQKSHFNIYKKLPADENVIDIFKIKLDDATPLSQPYWLQQPMSKGSFNVTNQNLIGKPENEPLHCDAVLDFDGVQISYTLPLWYKSNDPVKGEVYQPVFVIPGAEIRPVPEMALSINGNPVTVEALVSLNDEQYAGGHVLANLYKQKTTVTPSGKNVFSFKGDANATDTVLFSYRAAKDTFDQFKTMISYPHIPDIIYFQNADARIVSTDLKIYGKTAGYIPGAGDKIPEALEKMGYSVTTLSLADITPSNLSKFDVIVTGVRAYNIHGWLNNVHSVLMDYVKNGGVLFVQYNTNNNIGTVKGDIGPYPFHISRTRVTDEDAQVTFIDPKSTLLNFPNKITNRDFENWIQERSTYHADNYGSQYQPLLGMNDPNESLQKGSVIYTNYGKGRFVYCGLVFFRELPEGVPGAYRLFANLISRPTNVKKK